MTSSAEDRLLYVLKSRGAQTARDAGQALGITTAGAQQQLARLREHELVAAEDRREGRGRPRRYWRLTAAGHARFPDRHSDLTLGLLQSTERVFGREGLERLIADRESQALADYRTRLTGATSLEERLAQLADIRSREGYMAQWQRVEDGWVLVENHCPVCAAAAACQGLCRSELSLFRRALGPEARVERTDHILAGARRCAYRITEAAGR